ncbi:diguanylate cyclase [Janthinobacterium sp. PC23-8]|uniref:GGDEF domain-containing protein n=1 Tax=Janthinobacterium sp. PC23-8 TaxID=2012679 RepID=UPI0020CF1BD2|nr:GGDEF domain-containing protein [Janthinobacterium sp. PC23-8]
MAAVMVSAQRSFPQSVRGLREWVLGLLNLILASALFALNGRLPDLVLLPIANSVFLWGAGMQMIGTQKFYGEAPGWRLFHATWLLGLVVMLVWLAWRPDFPTRVAMYSFLMMALLLNQTLVIARHGERHLTTWIFALLSLLPTLALLHRGVMALQTVIAGQDLPQGGPNQGLYLAILSFMTLLLPVGFMTVATRHLLTVLEQRSNRDPLTSVLNRRGFDAVHARENARARRSGAPFAVMSIDLDFFKAINDLHGHAVGDQVLIDVAGVISGVLRGGDAVARFGGEEFVVLLSDTRLARAELVAQRIQHALREPRPVSGLPACTLSIGIACQRAHGEALDSLLLRSDQALYRAKQRGRDRVEIAGDASTPSTLAPAMRLFS